MKITRREFLIESTAAVSCAVIAPDLYRLSRDHLSNTNQPLLVPPQRVIKTLIARPSDMGDEYVFDVAGVPDTPPPITWREYFSRVVGLDTDGASKEELWEHASWGFTGDLDERCETDDYVDYWCRSEAPNVLAQHYLESLPLGNGPSRDGEYVGGLRFLDYEGPFSLYQAAHAPDKLSISLLQERLKQIGENTKIVVEGNLMENTLPSPTETRTNLPDESIVQQLMRDYGYTREKAESLVISLW